MKRFEINLARGSPVAASYAPLAGVLLSRCIIVMNLPDRRKTHRGDDGYRRDCLSSRMAARGSELVVTFFGEFGDDFSVEMMMCSLPLAVNIDRHCYKRWFGIVAL